MKIERKKDKNDRHFIQVDQREVSAKLSLKEEKRQHFIVGVVNSTVIEGTNNVVKLCGKGIRMVFWIWEYGRVPLNSLWPLLISTMWVC